MDPTETLIAALSAVIRIKSIMSDGGRDTAALNAANEELDEALIDLAEWRAKGGFEPNWRAARAAVARLEVL